MSDAGTARMDAAALRRWLAGRAAAERRERRENVHRPLSAAESLRQAFALIAFAGRRHGWPLPEDTHSRAEDERGYARWDRLRAAWSRDGGCG